MKQTEKYEWAKETISPSFVNSSNTRWRDNKKYCNNKTNEVCCNARSIEKDLPEAKWQSVETERKTLQLGPKKS